MTIDKGIFIRNIYYMLTYAFQELKQNNYEEIAGEEFEEIHDLFAEILLRGISFQLKQGLHKEYISCHGSLSTLKGKLDICGTVNNLMRKQQKIDCEYDELSENNKFNQILKTTVQFLLKHPKVKSNRKAALKRLMLFFSDVEAVDILTINWTTMRFDRNCKTYRMLLYVCYFILDGMLMTTERGAYKMKEFSDEHMCRLYEKFVLEYSSEDKDLMDLLRTKAEELARQVNPGAANNSMHERSPERILADCIAGVVSEYFWKLYLNSEENVVSETEFDDASRQIDLKVISNNKKIEVRSSFPRNGIEFAICHPSYEFDVIGPYSNNYKPGEIQKDYYVRTLFHLYNPTDIISMISADSFKVYLTGGATWDMMIDNDYSKNKTLLPDFGLGVIQKASYRVVPFSKSKDTREIKRVIIEDQQVKN